MRVRFATVLAMTVHTIPVHAQADTTTVLPGDARLDPERVAPHRATWRVTVHDSAGGATVQGLWTDIWARSREGGRPIVIFRQLYVDTTGAILVDNETVFDAATFRALRSSQHVPPSGGRVSYRYEGDSATGTLWPSAGAGPRDFRVVFDQPVWEPLAPVLGLFPLERCPPGAVIRYPVWNQTGSGNDVTWTAVRVDSIENAARLNNPTIEACHFTLRTAATPNVVMRLWRTPEPPWGLWLRVERPGLIREWTLVDWEPFAGSPAAAVPR